MIIITLFNETFSAYANNFWGNIRTNTLLATQSPIYKLALFIAEKSVSLSDADIKTYKSHRSEHKSLANILEKAVLKMSLGSFLHGEGGIIKMDISHGQITNLKN